VFIFSHSLKGENEQFSHKAGHLRPVEII